MTIEELVVNKQFGIYEEWITLDEVKEAMQEYAKAKCKELLEIVADKVRLDYDSWDDPFVNKGSILNCIDLNEFIV